MDSVTCIQPPILGDRKTDYNDLAKAGKQSDVRHHVIDAVRYIDAQQIKQKIPQSSEIKDFANVAQTKNTQEELSLSWSSRINQERII